MTSGNLVEPTVVRQADQLAVKVYANRRDLGRAVGLEAAAQLKRLLAIQKRANVIFAAAPSQNEFLDTLSSVEGIEWDRVTAMHMDEYVGLSADAPQRFGNYLKEHIFDKVKPGGIHYLDGNAAYVEAECERYSNLLRENPVDIVFAGIGENGHLAFNDPGVADFLDTALVKVVTLDEMCRQQQVNDGCFGQLSEVPTQALTLTVPSLTAARWIYAMVPGPTKAEAVSGTLSGEITPDVPATILRIHPRAVLYIDEDSAAKLSS